MIGLKLEAKSWFIGVKQGLNAWDNLCRAYHVQSFCDNNILKFSYNQINPSLWFLYLHHIAGTSSVLLGSLICPLAMIEQAPDSICAVPILVKFEAGLRPVLAIYYQACLHLIQAMCEPTLELVGASSGFHPLFTQLSLVLVLVWDSAPGSDAWS